MADEHRRVEPRSIVGTGMATDRERIETLEAERDRRERIWREAPKRRFGEVLSDVDEEEEEDEQEPRAAASDEDGEEPEGAEELPRVPPDPRMAKLHAMVQKRGKPPRDRGRS